MISIAESVKGPLKMEIAPVIEAIFIKSPEQALAALPRLMPFSSRTGFRSDITKDPRETLEHCLELLASSPRFRHWCGDDYHTGGFYPKLPDNCETRCMTASRSPLGAVFGAWARNILRSEQVRRNCSPEWLAADPDGLKAWAGEMTGKPAAQTADRSNEPGADMEGAATR